ncbi:hypothetical protein SADUNF_Sadunf02G0100800 [Salix dunnii]|uniref:Uncharacterized protein n=1 Tax=Salix dunnii TaxID=1413687 RepID=A0A835N712_9ROSI|nr:hypothetical protein SADUNF_Sadunf02G0100800 [Salix dunnii]
MQLELIIVLKVSNLPNLSVAEKIGIGLVLSDVENTDARMCGELLVYSSFFAPLLVWKLGLHLSVEKAEKKKANTVG